MARGVSRNFLNVTRREERLGRRTALVAAALAPVAAFLADLSDGPGYGPVWMLFVFACIVGLVGGIAWSQRRLAHVEADLKLRWNHWMRHSASAERLADIERRVNEKDPLPPGLWSGVVAVLVGLNVALFALLWIAHPAAEPLSWLLLALDGLVLGGLVSTSAMLARWAREFERSAEALVQEGELAMWGER